MGTNENPLQTFCRVSAGATFLSPSNLTGMLSYLRKEEEEEVEEEEEEE